MPDISMGDAHAEVPSSPVPPAPSTPKRPPKRPRPVTPTKEPPQYTIPRIDFTLGTLPSPCGITPQSQLGLELQQHVSGAIQTRCGKLQSLREEVRKFIAWASNITTQWEELDLPEAATLGRDMQHLVLNFSQKLAGEAQKEAPPQPPSNARSYAGVSQAVTNSPAPAKQQASSPPPSRKPPRIFLRLPSNHPARTASPHASLARLRQLPIPQIASGIKEVQRVPSGLALLPQNHNEAARAITQSSSLEQAIPGAKAELEQEWAVYALPNVPRDYTDYEGQKIPISEQSAKDELTFQTGLKPHRFYAPKKNPNSNTYIMMLPKDPEVEVPSWVTLFGQSVMVKLKPPRARFTQCQRCWGFHNPRKCIRKPRCRVCGMTDHQEEVHPAGQPSQPRCTNCLGRHPADHPDCPVRPTLQQGVIQRPSKLQVRALRRAGTRQNPQSPSAGLALNRPAEPNNPSPSSAPCEEA